MLCNVFALEKETFHWRITGVPALISISKHSSEARLVRTLDNFLGAKSGSFWSLDQAGQPKKQCEEVSPTGRPVNSKAKHICAQTETLRMILFWHKCVQPQSVSQEHSLAELRMFSVLFPIAFLSFAQTWWASPVGTMYACSASGTCFLLRIRTRSLCRMAPVLLAGIFPGKQKNHQWRLNVKSDAFKKLSHPLPTQGGFFLFRF